MQKKDYEKTCTKKHEKHVQKTRAENNREKQAYRKNKPVQKIRAQKKQRCGKQTRFKPIL